MVELVLFLEALERVEDGRWEETRGGRRKQFGGRKKISSIGPVADWFEVNEVKFELG